MEQQHVTEAVHSNPVGLNRPASPAFGRAAELMNLANLQLPSERGNAAEAPATGLPSVAVVGPLSMARELRSAGFDCRLVAAHANDLPPPALLTVDLWVLEWRAVAARATELLAQIRKRPEWWPVIVVLEEDDESAIIQSMDLGADSCVTASSGSLELAARARALLRRHPPCQTVGGRWERYGNIAFDLDQGLAYVGERRVVLPSREFQLARFLFKHTGRVLSNEDLMHLIWGGQLSSESRSIVVLCSRLRVHLGLSPATGWHLGSVRGVGYCLRRMTSTTTSTSGS